MIQNLIDSISNELGYTIPSITLEGKTFHRFGKKNCCWIIGHHLVINRCDYFVVYFGDFSKNISGEKTNFNSESASSYYKTQFEFHSKNLALHVETERIKAFEKFKTKWNQKLETLSSSSHSYLDFKQIKNHGAKTTAANELLIPIHDENNSLMGLQKIFRSNIENKFQKIFEKGSMVQGNFYSLTPLSPKNNILISEGFATAATIQQLFPNLNSVCAFSANNLIHVAKKIRSTFPKSKILICADRDKSEAGEKEATKACINVENCFYVMPKFQSLDFNLSDFNDLAIKEGEKTAELQIQEALERFNNDIFNLDIQKGFVLENSKRKLRNKDRLREYFEYKFSYFVSGEYVYCYDNSHFKIFDDSKIAEFAQTMYSNGGTVDTKDIREFINLIKRTNLRPIDEIKPERGFNFSNGFLPINANNIIPHNPDQFQFNIIPHPFVPDALAPTWDLALNNLTRNDVSLKKIIEEYLGYILSNDDYIRYPVALILDGHGNNGKTTLLSMIRSICGIDNVSSVSIEDFSKNRFSLNVLKNKMVNFDEEASCNIFKASDLFKKITGGSSMRAEEKFKSSYEFINKAKFILSYNIIPIINDISLGMTRRLLFIPCNQDFGTNSKLKISDLDLKIQNEASGVINLAINSYKKMDKLGRFTESLASELRKSEVLKLSNPFMEWFESKIEITSNSENKVTIRELYEDFISFSFSNISLNSFGRIINTKIKMLINAKVSHKDIKFDGKTLKGLTGVKLR